MPNQLDYLGLRQRIAALEIQWEDADSKSRPTIQIETELAAHNKALNEMPAAVRIISVLTHSTSKEVLDFRLPFMRRSCLSSVVFTAPEKALIETALAEFKCLDDVRIKAYLDNPDEN